MAELPIVVWDLCALWWDPGAANPGASASETAIAPSTASFQASTANSRSPVRSTHGKSGASPLVTAELDRLVFARLRLFSHPLIGGNTNQISLRAGVRVPARASSRKDGDLWFSDLEPFSFHFEPQCRHGDLLITERRGGRRS